MERLSKVSLNLYPDVEKFYEKVSNWLNVDRGSVFLGEGVSGLIKSVLETIAMKGDNIIFPSPTFAMYPVYGQMFDLECRNVGYLRNYTLDFDELVSLINDNTAVVFLPNPNVPIEGALSLEKISQIANHCKRHNAFLVIDEVYYLFGGQSALGLLKEFDNLFIMRSFSKAFGLAGIRLGYLLGNKKYIDYVSKTRTGYETNSLSMETASFFIENLSIIEGYINETREGLNYLKGEFDKLSILHSGGDSSNFLFVNLNDKNLSKRIVDELRKDNVYIRGGWQEPYEGFVSITGGPKYIMEEFICKFNIILKNVRKNGY